jgi:hypothetical protein
MFAVDEVKNMPFLQQSLDAVPVMMILMNTFE